MKRGAQAPSARLFFVDDAEGSPVASTRRLADPPSPPPRQLAAARDRGGARATAAAPTAPVDLRPLSSGPAAGRSPRSHLPPVVAPIAVAPAPAPIGAAAPAPAPKTLPEAVPGLPPTEAVPDLPPTTLGRFSLLQKQLQALDEAAANEKAQQDSIKKKLREARKERDLRSTKAKSYQREAALAAIAAKRLELAMADEAYNKAEQAKQEARVKLEVMDRDTVVATKAQFRATASIREAERARKHDAALASIAAETASVALEKLAVENELAKLQLQKREADRTASLSTAALLERELGDELREALVTSAGLAALPPEFPGDEKEQGLELAMASPSSVTTPRATTPSRDLDPEEDAEHCIASFEERRKALEKEAASAMQEVAWASNALSGLEDIASVQDEALDAAALARAQKQDMEKLERREAETYGFDGVGAWDPVRGALIKVVRGVVLELGKEFITDLISEVAHAMNDECDKARSLIFDALTGLVDGGDLRTLEEARSELLARNMNNERAVPTRAARRLASIEPTLLFLPGLDGCIPKPSLKTDTPIPPRPRLIELGEPVSTICCSRGVTVTDDEASTVFIAVGGRRGGVAIGSVAHRPNPRYVDEDDDDEVIKCMRDTIYPTTNSQIVSLCIGRRRRRLCAIDGSGLIRVWRFDLSPTLQIKDLRRETRFDMYTIQSRCRTMQLPRFVRIDDDDDVFEGEDAWIRRDDAPRLLVMDSHGTGCRWQCLPAPPLPPQKKGWFWQKKRVVPEPNDRGVVLELLQGEGGKPLCCSTNVSVDSYGLVSVWPAFSEGDADCSVQRRVSSVEPDVLGRVVTAAPSCTDRDASVLYNEGPRGTALEQCLHGDAVSQAAPNVYMRGGATYSSSVRDGALVSLRERVVAQNDRAEVVSAAGTADGVVVLCRRSKLLTAAVVECGSTEAPRVDASRSVALRGEAEGDVSVAACAGRVFIRKGEELLAFRKGREEFSVRVGEGVALAASEPGVVAAASGDQVAVFDVSPYQGGDVF